MELKLNNTFTDELPGDKETFNFVRQVNSACFSYVEPTKTKEPQLVHVVKEVSELIGLTEEDCKSDDFLKTFTGNKLINESRPYAMCYAGHQFGQWAGQLGDGRAINLAEVEHKGKRWALQLKGAGLTPYSRTADGLAVLRSSIREHLCSEAMFHLGVPTTRSLSLSLTGDDVLRDMLYDGNASYEKGAIVCRVAPSFLRFGSYEIFSSKDDNENLKTIVDYTMKHFYPNLEKETKKGYVQFFREVSMRTLDMVIHWQRVGFVHGVMNTDNMSILGLTIDYGPYGWLEGYDKNWTPNTTDYQNKRYKYGQQSNIALWNLLRLANSLFSLIEEADPLEEVLTEYKSQYALKYLKMMKSKIGLDLDDESDKALIDELEANLRLTETDMTIFFRNLSKLPKGIVVQENDSIDFLVPIMDAFYTIEEVKGETRWLWRSWFKKYFDRLQKETDTDIERKEKMDIVNPKYVLRNYMAQVAIDAADDGDYSVIKELHELLKKPYDNQSGMEKWFVKRPEWARTKAGCSMLSCSS